MQTAQGLTWVEALKRVESRCGGQLEGQRGQGVLLPEDARLALADCQDLGVLVQGQVGVDGQGRDRRRLLALRLLLLRLLLEALRLRLACIRSQHLHRHLSACWKSFLQRERTFSPIVMLFLNSVQNQTLVRQWDGMAVACKQCLYP